MVFLLQDRGRVYGAERAVLGLAVALRRAGTDAQILLIEESRLGEVPADFRDTADALGIPWAAHRVSRRLSPGLVRTLARLAPDESLPLVIHSSGDKAAFHAGLAAGLARRLIHVSTVHGWLDRPDPKEQCLAALGRMALRRADAVIALSSYYQDRLARAGVPKARIHLIRPGFVAGSPADWPGPPAQGLFTVVLPARLSEEKNPGMLLKAMVRIRDSGTRLQAVVAGEGPLQESLARQIGDLGLASHVEIAGHLAPEAWLARAHAVVLCSKVENQPIAILEAMAAARPVVATRVGGIPDMVEDGVTGLLVHADDPDTLARALTALAHDPVHAARLGAEGRQRLIRHFAPEAMVQSHQMLYRSLVHSARGKGSPS